MADQPKKSNYTLWILIGLGILILGIGICVYFIWRKSSALDLNLTMKNNEIAELKLGLNELKSSIKSKDTELSELKNKMYEQRDEYTKIKTKLKQVGIKVKRQDPIKTAKGDCKDGSCEVDVEEM